MPVNKGWPLHQLDVLNVFPYGDPLNHDVYDLKQNLGAWFAKFNRIILTQALTTCKVDPIVFNKNIFASSVVLAFYVVDILIIENDTTMITCIVEFL